jgi:hypothetical protein
MVSTKIDFSARKAREVGDVTDLVAVLCPGNHNQQHAAGRILLALKGRKQPLRSLSFLEDRHGISRRTLQRTRAKLSRLGLIERIGWMNGRYGGQEGWMLSGRFVAALRQLAERTESWRKDLRPDRIQKDELLLGLLRR